MRRAGTVAMLAALLLALAGPAVAADDPPHAYQRLDRISAALEKDPLFVDPDVSHALGESERARVRRAIGATSRSLGVPAYVVVVPNPGDSESQGRDEAFLFALHERSGRDGLYLMSNSRGGLESEAFRVPRRYRYSVLDDDQPGSWRPADRERPFDDLAQRIVERLDSYATAPSASPGMPTLYSSPDPFGEENTLRPAEPEISGPLVTGLLFAGPAAAVLLYWTGVGVLALLRRESTPRNKRKPVRHGTAWTEPSMRRLRRQAANEVGALRQALVTADAERGRPYAISAYDAAQILYDDAKEDEDRAIDLVGAIVLARQGQAALSRDIADPPVPCVVNPLHGDSVRRRRLAKLTHKVLPKPCPLCETCAGIETRQGLTDRHLLKVPGPGRSRPHTAIPGVWRDTAWGATGKKFLPRVMRYLGVE
ncbi:hypothetical protein [Actinomadura sp. 6K520]|uniref:hypothetical protein n=1 Tax=Actinomadura sp. 6K520 TaxID=2530364 RepID=UPI0010451638|nr:hypothetical protein [Actinomadura sp. 6K520]TDE38545.1 hypothetical protein E1289_02245 [Actinomadura sp. 6K520]